MNDTVREELQTKIVPGVTARRIDPTVSTKPPALAPPAAYRPDAAVVRSKKPVPTAGLSAAKTSPTLVEFQNKNAPLPDWRIHLQNAVQQRRGTKSIEAVEQPFSTMAATALKAEVVQPTAAIDVDKIVDPRVANAVRRINQSRSTFATATPASKKAVAKPAPPKQYPFDVVSTAQPAPPRHTMPPPAAKPKLVVPTQKPAVEAKRDTNKLPPLETIIAKAKPIERVEPIAADEIAEIPVTAKASTPEFAEINRIRIKAESVAPADAENEFFDDEIEDLAPVSMRFGAGLFDMIVGGFASMLVLAPLALNGDDWFTASGTLIAAGIWACVMFLYMTLCLGLLGRTLGMRLFSLELVDAVENEYPTLQQAAVNSSLFLLSLTFFGSGFITMFFNEERRAVHDLLSGTILVREF